MGVPNDVIVDDLAIGPALDAAVGSLVMGLREVRLDRAGNAVYDGGVTLARVPDFSTKIADAWQIVSLLRDCGQLLALQDLTGIWEAEWAEDVGDIGSQFDGRYAGQGDTAQEAICRASLRLVARTGLKPWTE